MRSLTVFAVFCLLCTVLFAQKNSDSDSTPPLQHFNPDQVDHSLDPCSDFFQYACSKWIKANPIPADQAGSGTFTNLAVWNTAAIHATWQLATSQLLDGLAELPGAAHGRQPAPAAGPAD